MPKLTRRLEPVGHFCLYIAYTVSSWDKESSRLSNSILVYFREVYGYFTIPELYAHDKTQVYSLT